MALLSSVTATTSLNAYVVNGCWSAWDQWVQTSFINQQASVWGEWVSSATTVNVNYHSYQTHQVPYQQSSPLSQQDAAAIVARQNTETERRKKESAKRKQAEDTASALLRQIIPEEQEKTLEKDGYFYLTVDENRYRIEPGRAVKQVDADGKELASFCIHAPYNSNIPPSDQAICHYLMLSCEPEEFFRTANRTQIAS